MNSKIVLVFVLGVVWWTVKGITEEDFNKVGKECQKQLSATDADLTAVMNLTAPLSQKQGCLAGCMMKKLNVMDSKNSVNLTVLLTIFADDSDEDEPNVAEVEAALNACLKKKPQSSDECIVAKNYLECFDDIAEGSST